MLDLILLLIACFVAIPFFLPFAVVDIDILFALFGQPKRKPNYQSRYITQSVRELDEDSIGDSEGDGLMLFDDPMFPPEEED